MIEYRAVFHTLDNDLNKEMNLKSERGWYIKSVSEPRKYKDSEDEYILIIWERAKQHE